MNETIFSVIRVLRNKETGIYTSACDIIRVPRTEYSDVSLSESDREFNLLFGEQLKPMLNNLPANSIWETVSLSHTKIN